MKKIILFLALICSSATFAQRDSAIHFSATTKRIDARTAEFVFTARLASGLKLYALQKPGATMYSSVLFDSSILGKKIGAMTETGKLQTEMDTAIGEKVYFFTDSVQWRQKLSIGFDDSLLAKVSLRYSYFHDRAYLSGEHLFKIPFRKVSTGDSKTAGQPLWSVFLLAFAGGLIALLTPCVYSMIPVTVSFFTKRSTSVKEGRKNAVFYAASIILIFTGMGFFVTLVFGPAALNNLSTNWVANLFFFILFIVFGFSFLGAFEIGLPSAWSTKADERAGVGNFGGIFFMALTLVVVSFSCTGPIIGNLLVLAARGSWLGPLTGMFGFSLALSIPFALFAFFPGKMHVLGKAGGWLNAVKVTLGFLELALALKFLSNADLAKGWRLLDREIFISLWIVLFVLLGIYLLGKLKFHHDDALPKNDFGQSYLSVTRLCMAILAFSFSVYMVPGLWGAPLKGISAFIPPMGTQDFLSNTGAMPAAGKNILMMEPLKYKDQLKIYEPEVVKKYDLSTYYDYKEAMAAARLQHKPLMLDFTGINCVNCRKMEGSVWSDPEVMKRLKENFVIASLYVDARQVELQPDEYFHSKVLDKQVDNLGDKNADFQVTMFGSNSQPYYFFVDGKGEKLAEQGYGYDPDPEKFRRLLDKVVAVFQEKNKSK